MKRMKQAISWLLVLAMMISLMPANLVRAEGEEEAEANVYSVYINPDVYAVDTYPSDDYINGFSVTVPDEQSGVTKDESAEYYWNVTEDNSLTIYVTVPGDCDVSSLVLENNTEAMDVTFTKVDETENTYSTTITPEDNMSLSIYDGTYCSIELDYVTPNFNCYVSETVDSTESMWMVKRGASYVLHLESSSMENISAETLSLSINEKSVLTDDLVSNATGWTYTVNNVSERQNIKIYESDAKFTVTMPDLSAYGYAIYDENGENKIDYEEGNMSYEVAQGGNLTFQVKQEGTATETAQFDLYVGEEKLVETDGVYTISNVTWPTSVDVYKKYSVSAVEGSNLTFVPCTADGEPLTDDGDSVSEYYYRENSTAYFKLAESNSKGYVKSDDGKLMPDDNGVYSVWMGEAPIALTFSPYYYVSLTGMSGCWFTTGNDDVYYDTTLDEENDVTYYHVEDSFIFNVEVDSESYKSDRMTVTLKNADGNNESLEYKEKSTNESGNEVYSFEVMGITQDAEIVVEGLYSIYPSWLTVYYDKAAMSNLEVAIAVWDEEGNAVEMVESDYSIQRGLPYTLRLSGSKEVLETLKVTADGKTLAGTIEDDVMSIDITNLTDIYIATADQYYVAYECAEDDNVGGIYVVERGAEDEGSMDGYHSKGEISFWIEEGDSCITAENAYVKSIKDGEGNEVTYTTEENVEVDEYGKKRTVYTVNLTSDITIIIAGGEYLKYDVYLPLPAEDDEYTISNLYVMEDVWDDEKGDWCTAPSDMKGAADTTSGCTKYSSVNAGTTVYFDIITATANGTPYVQNGDDVLDFFSSEEVNETNTKYTYMLYVSAMSEIDISVDTEEISVVADGYSVEYEGNGNWMLYKASTSDTEDDEENEREAVLEIYGLPKIIDYSDTEKQYYISYEIYDETLMLDDQNDNKFFSVKNADGETKSLNIISDIDSIHDGQYKVPVKEGYTTLVVDMSLLEPRNGKVNFVNDREDDVKIEIEGTEGTDYEKLTNQDYEYKVLNQQLTFTITAKDGATLPDDLYVSTYYYTVEKVFESKDGTSVTYTLSDVRWNGEIRISYEATITFEKCVNGGIYTNVWGDGFSADDMGNVSDYGSYASGRRLPLDFYVDEGYNIESVTVVQEYTDEEGEIQTITYTDFDDGVAQDYRCCDVTLQPGKNTFYITAPEKKTYTMSMPTGTAYDIELVNGSRTTVEYMDSCSFKVNAKDGYDLSNIVVYANKQKVTPDENGVYTIKNVSEDYEITITGFKASTHVVTFKDYDGKVLKKETITHGKSATAPASPTRDGYTFAGWDTTFTKVTKDMSVTATYKPILVSKLKVTGNSKNLAVNKTIQLTATAEPSNALNTDVVWTTSNKKYATVSATGKVKALKKGAGKTVTITATAKDGSGVKATYKIKIYKNAVKKIKLSAKTKSVKPGKKVTIKAKVSPSKSVCKTLKWTSSNTKYATVNSKGVVTTKKAGKGKTVTITAKATDGSNKKATIKIKIKKK